MITTQLAKFGLEDTEVMVRRADRGDVPAIVGLLAADPLGQGREDPEGDMRPYLAAFEKIDSDHNQLLVVAVNGAGVVVGTMQLTFMPGLSHRGALRANVEAVRVHHDYRNLGLGTAMMRWAMSESRWRGCALMQLTSAASRVAAHRFYHRLGFATSHVGFKLAL